MKKFIRFYWINMLECGFFIGGIYLTPWLYVCVLPVYYFLLAQEKNIPFYRPLRRFGFERYFIPLMEKKGMFNGFVGTIMLINISFKDKEYVDMGRFGFKDVMVEELNRIHKVLTHQPTEEELRKRNAELRRQYNAEQIKKYFPNVKLKTDDRDDSTDK